LFRTNRDGTVTILSDGETLRVVSHPTVARAPSSGQGRARSSHGARPKPAGGLVNVNTATAAELEALPGVGPVIARRIVEGRPYRSVDDLDRVKGIGKRRLEEIGPLVTAE
jgi:competence ComEA-like helix-hairpin-helix protein